MRSRILRPSKTICELCEFRSIQRPLHCLRSAARLRIGSARIYSTSELRRLPNTPSKPQLFYPDQKLRQDEGEVPLDDTQSEQALKDLEAAARTFLAATKPPSEEDSLRILERCNNIAAVLLGKPVPVVKSKDGAASALLDLDESAAQKVPPPQPSGKALIMAEKLSRLVYGLVKSPLVYISPRVLDIYVYIQAHLQKPETLPEIFYLYANKPMPVEGSLPTEYKAQNPDTISNCIPPRVADRALQAAIDAKKLVAAMDIINASYTTTAFKRDKFLRKAFIPSAAVALAPVAVYTLASQLAAFQTTMETGTATQIVFAGGIAYLGFTGTLGIVAITTANDQMIRVSWAPGVPLRTRWMREDERAALDKVACAWGFKETWRRGEEEGEDWEALKEWISRKGMMLDRVELMEGME